MTTHAPHPRRKLTPLSAIARGAGASAVGTLAMDSLWYRRYRNAGGESRFSEWETSAGLDSWDDAAAPAKAGKLIVESLTGREVSSRHARLLNNLTHWGYGLFAGAQYGVFAGILGSPKLRYGLPFGAGVWASGYVVLPVLGVYKPIWKYDARTLRQDLSAHLVFGIATASAYRALTADRAAR